MKERPNKNDYNAYFETYVSKVGEQGFLSDLQSDTFLDLISGLSPEKWNYRYAEGKWNIKEVLMHIMDTERIFAYRALRISRHDKADLAGFDQDDYVPYYDSDSRTAASLIEEYKSVRASTLSMFENFSAEHYAGRGTASGYEITTLALGYMIAGHELHHQELLVDRYQN